MNSLSKSLLWIFLVAALIVGAIWQFYPLPTAQNRLQRFPLISKTFTGQDVDLTESEAKFFKDVDLLKRVYKIGDRYFFVILIDGSKNRHTVHDPYYCFRGSGWNIDSEKPFPLPRGTAKLLEISKGAEKRQALFWFSNGQEQYSSPLKYWWQTTLRRTTLGASGDEPLLIIIQPLEAGPVNWDDVLNNFKPLLEI